MDIGDKPYCCLLGGIMALINEVEKARFLNRLDVPLSHAPQLHLLEHFAVFRPHLFRKKLHVNPVIFDCIVNKICKDYIFHSRLNNLQLPVSIQLAIFLNHAGHYGNAISPEDVSQWAVLEINIVMSSLLFMLITYYSVVTDTNEHDLTFIRYISPILIRISVTDMIRSVTPLWYYFIPFFADHYNIIFYSY